MYKLIDKFATITLGCKVTICGRSVSWWDEEINQLVRVPGFFAQALDKEGNWSDYLTICEGLKQKIREKRKICTKEFMVNIDNTYRKNMKAFWKFINWPVKSSKNRIETLLDGNGKGNYSREDKVKILKL